jgi:hypothetical protein
MDHRRFAALGVATRYGALLAIAFVVIAFGTAHR